MRNSVIIGVNQYESVPRLTGCVRDAVDIAETLEMPEYGFKNKILVDSDATRRNCLDALWSAVDMGGKFLVIYFAGHGSVRSGVGYLVTADGVAPDPGIALTELAQIVATASEKYDHVFAILDSCHSGAGSTWVDHRPLTASTVSESIYVVNSSRILMAACRPEQFAHELPEPDAHGAFTKVLLDGLMGDAVDYVGNVTVHALFETVAARMDTNDQTPVFKGDSAGSVVLGSGFQPRAGAPIAPNEKAALLSKGERLLDEYQLLHTAELSQADHRRSTGLNKCARSLNEVIRWFKDTERTDADVLREPEWRQFLDRLLNYQAALASVGVGDITPLGKIERKVGGGGFGNVWELCDEAGQRVAYKVFHGPELADAVKAKRFRNGFHSMASLSHPQIVGVKELTEAPLGFSMDLIDGADLRDAYVDRDNASLLLTLALDIADTIRYAHGAGVVHRDIKPENVILRLDVELGEPVPHLTDFDLAYIETNRTVTINMVGGVVNYAAPEQFYASNGAAARALTVDVYAFGQLLFYLIVGSDPSADRRDRNADRFRTAIGELYSYQAAEILIALYASATQTDPRLRQQSMDEICAQLTRAKILHDASEHSTGFEPEEVCRQVAYGYVGPGRFAAERGKVTLQSRAGTLSIEMEPRGVPARNSTGDFQMTISATQKFGVPGAASGTQGRLILNQRLDRRLQRFQEVTRTPGNQGYFQTHIRATGVPLNAAGVGRLAEILAGAIGAIEQLD